MKHLIIKSLALHNFKGIRSAEFSFSETGATVTGHNGTGKSTIADAFSWLLQGKDQAGKGESQFSIKTVDQAGDVIPDLEHSAEGCFTVIDKETGEYSDLRLSRSYVEEWKTEEGTTERKLDGHHVDYSVNDIPVTKKEFTAKVEEIIPGSLLKILIDPAAFFRQSADTQRGALIAMAGDVKPEEVAASRKAFADLLQDLNGETLDNYRTRIGAQRKRVKARLDKIPTEIDSTEAATPAPRDFDALEAKKKELDQKIEELNAAAHNIADARRLQYEEAARIQTEIGKKKRARQEQLQKAQLAADRETDEKNRERRDLLAKIDTTKDAISRIPGLQAKIDTIRREAAGLLIKAEELEKENAERRKEAQRIAEQPYDPASLICPRFGHECTDAHACAQGEEAFNASKVETLNRYRKAGHQCNDTIKSYQERAQKMTEEADAQQRGLDNSAKEWQQQLQEQQAKLADLPEAPRRTLTLADLPGADTYEKELADLQAQADKATSTEGDHELSKPVNPDAKRHAQMERDEVLKQLGLRDTIEKNRRTVEKLRKEQGELVQEKALLERQLATAEAFSQALTDAVEKKVNKLFGGGVSFRMFKEQVDGKRVPDCVALVNGVRYPDVNTAGKVNAGLEVIRAISRHYGIAAPIFVDNTESVAAIDQATDQQIIRLRFVPGEPLTVTPD